MRHRLGRGRASQEHPALKQVDRLLSERPEKLEVPISGLPGRLDELFSIYKSLFELRDYRVKEVDRGLDDLWIARLERAGGSRRATFWIPPTRIPRKER